MKVFAIILSCCLVAAVIFFGLTPAVRTVWNNWMSSIQKADDLTNYETLKQVEDTCRAMISSYNADKMTYEQYRFSDNSEQQEWAQLAKMRANQTASTYNNYILKNNYVWKNDVPADIYMRLEYVE